MVYIQKDTETNLPYHFDSACAVYGAVENCYNYKLISIEEVIAGKWDLLIKNNLFVGSTEFMREVFKRVGLNDVRLPRNSNRKSEILTLEEVYKRREQGEENFIKPLEIKLFTGFVFDKMQYSSLKNLPLDTKIIVYKKFSSKIVSETRFYISNNEIVDARNYSGDFFVIPTKKFVESIIEDNKDFPSTYTIDIAKLESGESMVVEFNDMWAIGNYGIPNDLYVKLLKQRYFEIIKIKNDTKI